MTSSATPFRTRAQERIGTMVRDKWRIDALLGIGGTAAVYSATHRNGKRVAVKILRAELAGHEEVVTRFAREGYVANKIVHPGVVSVLDDDVAEDGAPFLVMDLLEGYSLERHTKGAQSVLPVERVMSYMARVLDVLVVAHAHGIIHRDIKPANVFLTRDDQIKVLDFGIARLVEPLDAGMTQTGTAIGTPGYMAPEQARGRWSEVDARTDLWAVGASLYALLIGHRPRRAETVQEELLAAMTQPMAPIRTLLPALPPELAEFVDRSVAFERDARFVDARQMQLELSRVAAVLTAHDADRASVPTGADTAPVLVGNLASTLKLQSLPPELSALAELPDDVTVATGPSWQLQADLERALAQENPPSATGYPHTLSNPLQAPVPPVPAQGRKLGWIAAVAAVCVLGVGSALWAVGRKSADPDDVVAASLPELPAVAPSPANPPPPAPVDPEPPPSQASAAADSPVPTASVEPSVRKPAAPAASSSSRSRAGSRAPAPVPSSKSSSKSTAPFDPYGARQ